MGQVRLMPYGPHFTITITLLAQVEAIAALRERIQSAAVQVAQIPALQMDTRARNAHSPTAIEGNPLTLERVRAVEAGEALAEPARVRRAVVNYFATPRHVAIALFSESAAYGSTQYPGARL